MVASLLWVTDGEAGVNEGWLRAVWAAGSGLAAISRLSWVSCCSVACSCSGVGVVDIVDFIVAAVVMEVW